MPSYAIYVNLDHCVLLVCFKPVDFFHGFASVLCLPSDCKCSQTRHGCYCKGGLYSRRQTWHHEVERSTSPKTRLQSARARWEQCFGLWSTWGLGSLQILTRLFPVRTCGSFEGWFYFWICGCHDNTILLFLIFYESSNSRSGQQLFHLQEGRILW